MEKLSNDERNMIKRSKLSRYANNQAYWPLCELDQLPLSKQTIRSKFANKPFVCTESCTIYDDLTNQTFTVINNLQLSQYNDQFDENLNLYACLVDADVRHQSASLAVQLIAHLNPMNLHKRDGFNLDEQIIQRRRRTTSRGNHMNNINININANDPSRLLPQELTKRLELYNHNNVDLIHNNNDNSDGFATFNDEPVHFDSLKSTSANRLSSKLMRLLPI